MRASSLKALAFTGHRRPGMSKGLMLPEAERSAAAAEEGRAKFGQIADVLTQALEGKSFLLGEQFSAADVMIGSTLIWGQMLGLLNDYPALAAYVGRLAGRPAFQRAQGD